MKNDIQRELIALECTSTFNFSDTIRIIKEFCGL